MATSWTPSSDGMPFYVRIADLRQREGDADFLFDTVRTSSFSIAYAFITEFRTVVRGGLLPAMDLIHPNTTGLRAKTRSDLKIGSPPVDEDIHLIVYLMGLCYRCCRE